MYLHTAIIVFVSIYGCICFECPTGWITGFDSCYLFHEVSLTWSEFSHFCRSIGSHLARIESASEQKVLADELRHFNGIFWLDGIDDVNEGDWRWASNYDERITETFWSPGEPNNANGDEDCMEASKDRQGFWNDRPCSYHNFGICEKEVE